METTGPTTGLDVTGPLRRLLWSREKPRPPMRSRISVYVVPLGVLLLAGTGLAAGAYIEENRELPTWMVLLIAVGSVLPVAVSYRCPVLAWRLAFPMIFIGAMAAGPREPWPWNTVQILGLLVVLGRLAVTQEPGIVLWATVWSIPPIFLYAPPGNAWGAAVLLAAIAASGDIVYRWRRTGQLLAEKDELTELERARRAVLEERARIAREMHDVVAHHMSMIAVRAETAPYRVPSLDDAAKEELATIAGAAREALTDMRRLLGTLRSTDDAAPTAPQPGLDDLPSLIETGRAAGLDLRVETADLGDVPETVSLAAYRIVQEALANAARHAPGMPVSVEARGFADRLELEIRNRLTGETPAGGSGGGHGLTGMRERATLLGGTLTTGPQRFDFVVTAVLPYDRETE